MSELSPLSGEKRKLDFWAVRSAFGPISEVVTSPTSGGSSGTLYVTIAPTTDSPQRTAE